MDINIRPAQLSDVESIFIVRTSVTENHLSREEMRDEPLVRQDFRYQG